jgi:hypothetical protein
MANRLLQGSIFPLLAARPWRVCRHLPLDLFVLGLIPILVMIRNPGTFISPIGQIDAWLYFGYYLNLPEYLRTFDGLYYSTRLTTIGPGWAVYQLLPPLAANHVLHLALYAIAVGSLYLILRDTVNRLAAYVGALGLATNSWFLFAVGWDYVDGFGIMYFLVAGWLLTLATRSRRPWFLLGAGATTAALGIANLTYVVLIPFLVAHFWVLNRQRRNIPERAAAGWFALGATGLVVPLGCINYLVAGRFWFLLPSIEWTLAFVQESGPNPWRLPISQWWMDATWLVFPSLAAGGAVLWLIRAQRASADPVPPVVGYFQAQLLALIGTCIVASWFGRTCLLQFAHYASLLLPAVFLALGGQLQQLTVRLNEQESRTLAGGASLAMIGCLLLPRAVADFPLLGDFHLLPALVAGSAAVALLQLSAGRLRHGLAAVCLLGVAQGFIQAEGGLQRSIGGAAGQASVAAPACADRLLAFRLITRIHRHIRHVEPSGNIWFWYSDEDPRLPLFTMLASTHGYMYRLVNTKFPQLPAPVTVGDRPMAETSPILVLSSDPDPLPAARSALGVHGLEARLLRQWQMGEGAARFTLAIIAIAKPADDAGLTEASDSGEVP